MTVAITGLGFVTSIGNSRPEVARSLRELRHGLAAWAPVEGLDLPVKVAGVLRGFDVSSANPAVWSWPEEAGLDAATVRAMPPHGVYAWHALRQALGEAGCDSLRLDDGRTGLYCASGGSPRLMHAHLARLESSGWLRAHPHGVVSSVAGALNFHLAALLGIRGASCGFSSACASGSHALGFAMDEIRLGRQDRMIVVAAEDLNAEIVLPFAGMGALSRCAEPALASRPFDRSRDGFVATGGAVAMVIERMSRAATRGARPLAILRGWGQAGDGHHFAMPQPEGRGITDAMRRALDDAGCAPDAVDYVNAHATSTPLGDKAEALAIREVFAGHRPAISSTKALTGHGLSLAGLMEAAFCVLALEDGFIPGQAHLKEPDDCCEGLHLPRESLDDQAAVVMNNSSGFGGANVAHIFQKT
jgi:3-oxoacyl-(acyl-carrier-protein) synthase